MRDKLPNVIRHITLNIFVVVLLVCVSIACSPKPTTPPPIIPPSLELTLKQGALSSERRTFEGGEAWQFEYAEEIELLNIRLAKDFETVPRLAEDEIDLQRLAEGKPLRYFFKIDGKKLSIAVWSPGEYEKLPSGVSLKSPNAKTLIEVHISSS